MIITGIVISISWSIALYMMIDKEIALNESMILSNKATYGYKWKIFGVEFILQILFSLIVIFFILLIRTDEYSAYIVLPFIVAIIILNIMKLGCKAVIYRILTKEALEQPELSKQSE